MKLQQSSAGVPDGGITVATSQHFCFVMLLAVVVAAYWRHLAKLLTFSFAQDQYSYIAVIPFVSLALVLRQRAAIFSRVHWAYLSGMAMIVMALAGTALQARLWPVDSTASLSATTACVWALLAGTFALCYGTCAVRAALFPILFLALMVPLPERILDSGSLLLQKASCQLTYLLFTLAGTPVLQNAFVLSTPQGAIEVAAQCSGIRSTLGLLIGGVVASHLFLRSAWKKTVLAVAVISVSIFKNVLRIVTLYWLGVHTDQRFLTGELHRYGGIPFSALAVVILGPLLWALYKSDSRPLRLAARDQVPTERLLEYSAVEARR